VKPHAKSSSARRYSRLARARAQFGRSCRVPLIAGRIDQREMREGQWKAGAGKRKLFDSRAFTPGAGSMVFDSRPLASFVRHELASLRIARNCFKRPALI
jgi:hypothetical protein